MMLGNMKVTLVFEFTSYKLTKTLFFEFNSYKLTKIKFHPSVARSAIIPFLLF